MLYLIVIIAANVLVVLLNALFSLPVTFGDVIKLLLSSIIGTVSVIAVDGIEALFIRRVLPEKLFCVKRDTVLIRRIKIA